MELKDYLESRRNERNLSQEEVANKLGFTTRTIKRWETGKTFPDPSTWEKLCSVYNLNKKEFVKLYSQNFLTMPKEVINKEKIVETKNNKYPEFLIKPFKLTKEEQDLIRLMEMFKDEKEYIVDGKKTVVKSLNPFINIPSEFLGNPLDVQELYIELKEKIGEYWDKVLSIIMSKPSELFNVKNLSKNEIIDLSSVTFDDLNTVIPVLSFLSNGDCKISTPINEETKTFDIIYPEMKELFHEFKTTGFKPNKFLVPYISRDKDFTYLVEKYKRDAKEYGEDPLNLEPPKLPVNHKYVYAKLTELGKELIEWYNG